MSTPTINSFEEYRRLLKEKAQCVEERELSDKEIERFIAENHLARDWYITVGMVREDLKEIYRELPERNTKERQLQKMYQENHDRYLKELKRRGVSQSFVKQEENSEAASKDSVRTITDKCDSETESIIREIIQNYFEVFGDRKRMQGLIRDYFPRNIQMSNITCQLINMGMFDELKTRQAIDNHFVFRFEKKLSQEWGIPIDTSKSIIRMWCKHYGQVILGKDNLDK